MPEQRSETQLFFEQAKALEADRPAFDKVQLFGFLYSALKRAGHVRVADADGAEHSATPGALVVCLIFWSFGAALGRAIGTGPLVWLVLSLGILVVVAAVFNRVAEAHAEPLGATVVLLWIGLGVAIAIVDFDALLWAYGVPVAALFAIRAALGRLQLRQARDIAVAVAGVARAAPFVAPVVLIVILLPALTADVWQLSADISTWNVVGGAAASIGILFVLVWRQLRRDLEPALTTRCQTLAAADPSERIREVLLGEVGATDARVLSEIPDAVLAAAWPTNPAEYAPYLTAAEGRVLRRPLPLRLAITTGAVGVLLGTYIYVLLAVTVPTDTAAAWSGTGICTKSVGALGLSLSLPGGPYLSIAALLGTFATAIFLAFGLTEERFTTALTTALLRDPIDRFLSLAIPFVSLVEWAVDYDGPLDLDALQSSGPEDLPSSGGSETAGREAGSKTSASPESTDPDEEP